MNSIIVIPVYKSKLDSFETISFNQCVKVLHKYTICILTHAKLDISYYVKELQNKELKYIIEFFHPDYFASIAGYNRLLLSLLFYQRFKQYKYMLIYQLDAYVFRDELEDWCVKGFDYIGAPWFEGWHEAELDSPIIGVGNGGLSLRKTNRIMKLLKVSNLYIYIYRNILSSKLFRKIISKQIIEYFNIEGYGFQNEDYYIFNLSKRFKWYKLAPISEAYKFSFDVNPEVLYKLNNNKLPFGCHAWQRYQFDEFWKQFINV